MAICNADVTKIAEVCGLVKNDRGRMKKENAEKFAMCMERVVFDSKDDRKELFTYSDFKKAAHEERDISVEWNWEEQLLNSQGFVCSQELRGCLFVFDPIDIALLDEQGKLNKEVY